jgi:hypothetical protein
VAGEPKAEILLNGRRVGYTNAQGVLNIPSDPGTYSVQVRKAGYETVPPQTADVKTGVVERLAFKLVAQPATVAVAGGPAGARAVLVSTGQLLGTVRPDGSLTFRVPAGEQVISFTKDQSGVALLRRRFSPADSVVIRGSEIRFPEPDRPDPEAIALKAWDAIKNTSDPRTLESFLNVHRNSGMAGAAEERLRILLWAAVNKNNAAELSQFRQRYPDSPQAREALNRIAQLDFDRLNQNDSAALRQFASRFPGTDPAQRALYLAERIRQRDEAAAAEKANVARIAAEKLQEQQRLAESLKQDGAAILTTIRRYESAFLERDPTQIKSAWPTIPDSDFEEVRSALADKDLTISVQLRPLASPQIHGDAATLLCERAVESKTRGRSTTRKPVRVRVNLARANTGWVIVGIDSQ